MRRSTAARLIARAPAESPGHLHPGPADRSRYKCPDTRLPVGRTRARASSSSGCAPPGKRNDRRNVIWPRSPPLAVVTGASVATADQVARLAPDRALGRGPVEWSRDGSAWIPCSPQPNQPRSLAPASPSSPERARRGTHRSARHHRDCRPRLGGARSGPVERSGWATWCGFTGEKHWPGATTTTSPHGHSGGTHGKAVDWMEHVTDEQYGVGPSRRWS